MSALPHFYLVNGFEFQSLQNRVEWNLDGRGLGEQGRVPHVRRLTVRLAEFPPLTRWTTFCRAYGAPDAIHQPENGVVFAWSSIRGLSDLG